MGGQMKRKVNTRANSELFRPAITEALERRLLFAFQAGVNFQTDDSSAPPGYLRDFGQTYGARPNGYTYGWNASNTSNVFNRDSSASPDQRYDTGALMQAGSANTWEIAVPNGSYKVKIVAGDPTDYSGTYRINAEGTLTVNGSPSSGSRWVEGTSIVTVSDVKLTLTNASGAVDNRIAFIEITDSSRIASSPSAPTGLRATAAGVATIDLIWNDVSDNETGFRIERSTSPTTGFSEIEITAPGATFFSDTNRATSTTYYYRVRSTNGAANSSYSPVVSDNTFSSTAQRPYNIANAAWAVGSTSGATIQAEDFDAGGTGLAYNESDTTNIGGLYRVGYVDITRYAESANKYFVGWSVPGEWLEYTVNVSTAGTYNLDFSAGYAGAPGTFYLEVDGVDVTSSLQVPNTGGADTFQSVTKTGVELTAGNHVLRVVADTEAGTGFGVGNFNVFKLTRVATQATPAAPSNLVATVASTTQINLSWSDLSSNETGFKVDRATSSDFASGFATVNVGAGVTSYNVAGLSGNTTYYFRIRSYNANGNSSYTSTVISRTSAPLAPSGLNATAASASRINLTWTDNSGIESAFEIDRATNASFTSGLATFTASRNATSFAATGLANDTTYYFRVRATNAVGDSANSSVDSATTSGSVTGDITLTATPVSESRIDLSWEGVAGATAYRIEISNDGSSFYQSETVDATGTTAIADGFYAGQHFYFRVVAVGASGNLAGSNVAGATTPGGTPPPAPLIAGQVGDPDAPVPTASATAKPRILVAFNGAYPAPLLRTLDTFGNRWFEKIVRESGNSLKSPVVNEENRVTYRDTDWNLAYQDLLERLDADSDFEITETEANAVDIVVAGFSWGGVAAANLTNRLREDFAFVPATEGDNMYRILVDIPVKLLVTVDPVLQAITRVVRFQHGLVEPNVGRLVNFYQRKGGGTTFGLWPAAGDGSSDAFNPITKVGEFPYLMNPGFSALLKGTTLRENLTDTNVVQANVTGFGARYASNVRFFDNDPLEETGPFNANLTAGTTQHDTMPFYVRGSTDAAFDGMFNVLKEIDDAWS